MGVGETEGELVRFDVGEAVGGNDSKPDPAGEREGKSVGDWLGGEVLGKKDGLLDGGLLGDLGKFKEEVFMNIDSNEVSKSKCMGKTYNRW